MTIASKTDLLTFKYVRCGASFVNVTTKPTIDTSGISGYVRNGNTFFGVGNITTPMIPYIREYVRNGNLFNEITAKSTINASEFDYSRMGRPYWVKYTPPVTGFDATRFFMMF